MSWHHAFPTGVRLLPFPGWMTFMLIRTLMALLALVTILAIHVKYPYVETPLLVFTSAISIGSIVVPRLGKMAVGTLILLLELGLAFWVAHTLASFANGPMVTILGGVNLLGIACLMGVSSTLLYVRGKYGVWEALGTLGILLTLLLLHFHAQSPQVQGIGWILGNLIAIPWLIGLAVGHRVRELRVSGHNTQPTSSLQRIGCLPTHTMDTERAD